MNENIDEFNVSSLTLDRNLPESLFPIEKEVFFLIHYVCYSIDWKCRYYNFFVPIIKQSLKLVVEGKSRQ